MDRLLDAFRDKGTVDELGIGTIRDTFSDALAPGTSTLHSRARYLLFVPWAVTEATAHGYPADRAAQELRRVEVRLIEALRKGDPEGGVIGRDARAKLKRMPSVLYWSAMSRYRLKRCGHGIEQHLRFASERPATTRDEDDDVEVTRHHDPCFRQLPVPPEGWLENSDFTLTREEAEFLRDQIISTCDGTYLGWLVLHGMQDDPEWPWDEVLIQDLPPEPARVLAHARRFSQLYAGAPILYSLLLARAKGWQDGIDEYEQRLELWAAGEETQVASAEWRGHDFWHCLADSGWRRNVSTHAFVDQWVELVRGGQRLAENAAAADLVTSRERRLKGRRSRFVNAEALEAWEGGNGLAQLTFRWQQAKTLVTDIHRGLEAPGA